jgi:uncharacterized delta-60 repeat protein
MRVAPDRKIVVLGPTQIARLLPNGGLDKTFGANGLVALDAHPTPATASAPRALTVDHLGRVAVAGQLDGAFQLWRWSATGAPDGAFRRNFLPTLATHLRSSHPPATFNPIGVTEQTVDGVRRYVVPGANYDALRFNEDGSLDKTYGENGLAEGDPKAFNPTGYAMDHKSGALYLSGFAKGFIGTAVARITPGGQIDTRFGHAGIAGPPLTAADTDAHVGAIALTPAGAIYVAQPESHVNGPSGIGIWRLRPDGWADTSFGTGGEVVTRFPPHSAANPGGWAIGSVIAQPDGTAVVSGSINYVVMQNGKKYYLENAALLRVLTTGALDPTFGTGGKVLGGLGNGAAASLQGGQVLLAGDLDTICTGVIEGDQYDSCNPIGAPPGTALGFRIARYNS